MKIIHKRRSTLLYLPFWYHGIVSYSFQANMGQYNTILVSWDVTLLGCRQLCSSICIKSESKVILKRKYCCKVVYLRKWHIQTLSYSALGCVSLQQILELGSCCSSCSLCVTASSVTVPSHTWIFFALANFQKHSQMPSYPIKMVFFFLKIYGYMPSLPKKQ